MFVCCDYEIHGDIKSGWVTGQINLIYGLQYCGSSWDLPMKTMEHFLCLIKHIWIGMKVHLMQ